MYNEEERKGSPEGTWGRRPPLRLSADLHGTSLVPIGSCSEQYQGASPWAQDDGVISTTDLRTCNWSYLRSTLAQYKDFVSKRISVITIWESFVADRTVHLLVIWAHRYDITSISFSVTHCVCTRLGTLKKFHCSDSTLLCHLESTVQTQVPDDELASSLLL